MSKKEISQMDHTIWLANQYSSSLHCTVVAHILVANN